MWSSRDRQPEQDHEPGGAERELGVDELLVRLSDPDVNVRDGAVSDLEDRSDDLDAADRARSIEALRPMATDDPDPTVRSDAICALLTFEAPGAVDLALAGLHDPDEEVRLAVVIECIEIDDPRVVESLLPLLEDPDHDVRRWTALALGYHLDPAALEPLRATVRRERRFWRGKADVRKAAEEAITRIEAELSPPSPGRDATARRRPTQPSRPRSRPR